MPRLGFRAHPLIGPKHPRWKGGQTVYMGYIVIRKPDHPKAHNSYVFLHRLVAEEKLGRFLVDGETVHHINGDRLDNRPENLEVLSHRLHGRLHSGRPGAHYERLDDRKWLKRQLKKKTVFQLSNEIGCGYKFLRYHLHDLGIKPIVSVNGNVPIKFPQLRDKAWLEEKTKTMAQKDIASLLGCTATLVSIHQKRHGIRPSNVQLFSDQAD
jgi:hypothetical protein